MAETRRYYRNIDRSLKFVCSFCTYAQKNERRAGGISEAFRAASDGLSASDPEIYTSYPGRYDGKTGISEDGIGLYEVKTGKRTFCI